MLGRRQLIQFFSFLGLPWGASEMRIKPNLTESSPIQLADFYIAGFRYYDGLSLVDRLQVGDELLLVREPDNAHDDLAIALYYADGDCLYKLGFVPRSVNLIPANLLDQGINLSAKIAEINSNAEPWLMVAVDLSLDLTNHNHKIT